MAGRGTIPRVTLPVHRVLHDESAIAARVLALAAAIRRDIPDDDLVLVGVLRGGLVFTADMARALTRLGASPRVELAWLSLYEADGAPRSAPRIVHEPRLDLRGRTVVVLDDILDTGRTLLALRTRLLAWQPADLRICVLLDKPSGRTEAIQADYVGFEAPDAWVFGYGLDTEGEGRGLPYLAVRTG